MSLHERLRTETRAAHDETERLFDLPSRLASRESYVDLLCGLHDLHAAFEAGARPLLAGTPFAPALDGTARLGADLRALGRAPPPPPEPVTHDGVPEAVGAAYVFEGSRLGGLLIAREARRRLGLAPDAGCGFFAGDGKATAARWDAFRRALDATADPAHDGRVVASALRTFSAVAERLGRAPLPRAA